MAATALESDHCGHVNRVGTVKGVVSTNCPSTSYDVSCQIHRRRVTSEGSNGTIARHISAFERTYGLEAFAHDGADLFSPFLPKAQDIKTYIIRSGKKWRRFASRYAFSLGVIAWPCVTIVLLLAVWGKKALRLCRDDWSGYASLYSALACMGVVGGALFMTLATGVTSNYLYRVFLHLTFVIIFFYGVLLEVALQDCSGVKFRNIYSLATVAWALQRCMFQFVVAESVAAFEATLGDGPRLQTVWRAKNSGTLVTVIICVLWLHEVFQLDIILMRIADMVSGSLLVVFAICDLAFCVFAIVAYSDPHNLARSTLGELENAGLAADVPLAAQAFTLTRRFVVVMLWSLVLILIISAAVLVIPMVMALVSMRRISKSPTFVPLTLFGAVVNAVAALILSGVITRREVMSEQRARAEIKRQKRRAEMASSFNGQGIGEDPSWWAKVTELSQRGFTLQALLQFYRGLGTQHMTDFDPDRHTTKDVVRAAIIPLSRAGRCAYATVMMQGQPVLPKTMVTHNWGNLFRDLVAAIVADALENREFGTIADFLTWDIDVLETMLRKSGKLSRTYWLCAFSVNQHDNICGGNPFHDCDPLTGQEYPPCPCGKEKHFNTDGTRTEGGRSIECELNKFDDVMAQLAAMDPEFSQIICVDVGFVLFTRAWCIAEIAQAFIMGMEQRMQVISSKQLRSYENRLRTLKVEEMEATRQEDRDEILAKIRDTRAFDDRVQELIFGASGLLACWELLDGGQRMSRIGWWLRWCQARIGRKSCWLEVASRTQDPQEVQERVRHIVSL